MSVSAVVGLYLAAVNIQHVLIFRGPSGAEAVPMESEEICLSAARALERMGWEAVCVPVLVNE